ncbi:MAG: energy transducer TonB [Pedobacter sp.]|nr:MAG: energy transducer TonB [Pedobacter sp.]
MLNNSNLYGSEWLEVVFSNRNKNYGAYALRSQSASILLKSLVLVAPVFILFFVGPVVYNRIFPDAIPDKVVNVVIETQDVIHEIKTEEKKVEKKTEELKEEPEKSKPVLEKVKTSKFNDIVVVDKEVSDPPTSAELASSLIGSVEQEGIAAKGNALPVSTGDGAEGSIGGLGSGGNETEIYNTAGVDVYPEFPGGMEAWAKFIRRNLNYPYVAQDNGAQGKVYLSFVVERDGSITDVNVVRGIGYGCDEEAVRVIKKSPKWKAGMQNNKPVRVRYSMPIAYVLGN